MREAHDGAERIEIVDARISKIVPVADAAESERAAVIEGNAPVRAAGDSHGLGEEIAGVEAIVAIRLRAHVEAGQAAAGAIIQRGGGTVADEAAVTVIREGGVLDAGSEVEIEILAERRFVSGFEVGRKMKSLLLLLPESLALEVYSPRA